MEKILKLIVLLGTFFVLTITPVKAFDPLVEMNAVSQSPVSAYTLYIGMPQKDFDDNFSHLPGWERLTDTHWGHGLNGIVFVRDEHKGYYVKQELGIGIANGRVYSFEVKFRTENSVVAQQLREKAYQNITMAMGIKPTVTTGKHNKTVWSWPLDGENSVLELTSTESPLAAVRSEERYIVSISRTLKL